jgi:hypothetical protein
VSNDDSESAGEGENVTFSREEWLLDRTSTAFGLLKATPRTKERREGVKAILVETETFLALKAKTRDITGITPKIDVAEVINAALLLAAEDDAIWSHVLACLADHRTEQASKLRERLTANTLRPEPNGEREL